VHSFVKLIGEAQPSLTPPRVDDLAVRSTRRHHGRLEGAMLTHGNLSANLQNGRAWFTGLTRKEYF